VLVIGQSRLDVLKRAVREITTDGLILEFGVYRGATAKILSKLMPDKTIYGFDSFEGLPEDWHGKYKKGTFDLRGIVPELPENVVLVRGKFETTIGPFLREHQEKVAFINFDADLYLSTSTILGVLSLWDRIVPGTVLYFDEFISKSYSDEFRAFIEYGIPVRLISYYWLEDSYSSFAFKALNE
jgi:hypothetical protein